MKHLLTIAFSVFIISNIFCKDSTKISLEKDSVNRVILNTIKFSDTISIRLENTTPNTPTKIQIENNIPKNPTGYLTAIIPIITLILGFILNKWYDTYSSNKKLNEEGLMWVENLIQLKDPLDNQITNLEKYIPENDENNFNLSDPTFSIILECEEFNLLEEKSLVPFLSNSKKGVSKKDAIILAGKIKSTIKLISLISASYKQEFNKLSEGSNPYMSVFQENFNDFKFKVGDYVDHAIHTYTKNSQELNEANKMKKLMTQYIFPYIDNGEIDLFILSDEFVKPFIEATFVDRNNPIMKEILKLLNLCDRNIKALKMERKYFRIRLEKRLTAYKNQQSSINEILEDQSFPIKN